MIDTSTLRFDSRGLLTSIIIDATTGSVLMVGMMNLEAVEQTCSSQKVTFWSRSRSTLWVKGETSGNTLTVVSIAADCDADALLITARPDGPTCHTGMISCFGNEPDSGILTKLERLLSERKILPDEGSYTSQLLHGPLLRVAQKIGEEGVEVALALTSQDDTNVVSEAADLVFHLLVGLSSRGLTWSHILRELDRRHHRVLT